MKDHEQVFLMLVGFAIGAVIAFLLGNAGDEALGRNSYRNGYAAAVDSVRRVVRIVPYQSPGQEVARILDAYGQQYQFLIGGGRTVVTVGWMDSARATYDSTAALPVQP